MKLCGLFFVALKVSRTDDPCHMGRSFPGKLSGLLEQQSIKFSLDPADLAALAQPFCQLLRFHYELASVCAQGLILSSTYKMRLLKLQADADKVWVRKEPFDLRRPGSMRMCRALR